MVDDTNSSYNSDAAYRIYDLENSLFMYQPISFVSPGHVTWGRIYEKMYWIDIQLLFLKELLTCIQ